MWWTNLRRKQAYPSWNRLKIWLIRLWECFKTYWFKVCIYEKWSCYAWTRFSELGSIICCKKREFHSHNNTRYFKIICFGGMWILTTGSLKLSLSSLKWLKLATRLFNRNGRDSFGWDVCKWSFGKKLTSSKICCV